jgi:hypothetical protein
MDANDLKVTADSLLASFGAPIDIVRSTSGTPADPTKPWAATESEVVDTVIGVLTKRKTYDIPNGIVIEQEICIISSTGLSGVPDTGCRIKVNDIYWNVKSVKPTMFGGQNIIYTLEVFR